MTTTTNIPEMAPEYRPGRNRTGSAIAAFLCVMDDSATNGVDAVKVTTGQNVQVKGVMASACADGANGNVAIRGRVRVVASGAISAGVKIAPDSNGKVTAAASTDTVIGQSVDAATTDGDVILAEIDTVNSPIF